MKSEFESREAFECIFGDESEIDLSKDETGEYSFQPSRFAYSFFLVAWQYRQTELDELQKRVDAAKYYMKNIFSGDAEVDQCHLGDLLDILDGKIVDEIEQALKGGDQNTEKQPNKHAENIATKGVKGGDQ